MNEFQYSKIIWLCVLVTAVAVCRQGQAQPMISQSEETLLAVGRDNPFGVIFKKPTPTEPNLPSDTNEIADQNTPESAVEEIPELFVDTVEVKFFNAESLIDAVEQLSSEYGTIGTDKKNNSLIICDTKENLAKILAEVKKIDRPVPQLGVETVTLKFLNAEDLKAAVEGLSSELGSITSDSKSNSLIVRDTKENIERMLTEIRAADKTPPQIMIEVVIVDVQLNDDTEIGVNWDILSTKNYDIGYRQNVGFTSRLGSTAETTATIGNATAFVTTGTGGDFSVISGTIRNVIHLLQKKKDLEILADPRVMVLSGKTATIKAVEEIPYNEITETSEGGQLSSTEFKEVGVTLEVGATLTDNNLIYLTVDSEQNVETGESDTGVPVVDTRNAKTELLLEDGQVVVLGGLRRKETKIETEQIPLLGDLPLIGFLFRSTSEVVKNSELIVLLSPHIYKGEPIDDAQMTKYNEITKRPMLTLPTKQEKTLLEKIVR